jgi:hypothetical protein
VRAGVSGRGGLANATVSQRAMYPRQSAFRIPGTETTFRRAVSRVVVQPVVTVARDSRDALWKALAVKKAADRLLPALPSTTAAPSGREEALSMNSKLSRVWRRRQSGERQTMHDVIQEFDLDDLVRQGERAALDGHWSEEQEQEQERLDATRYAYIRAVISNPMNPRPSSASDSESSVNQIFESVGRSSHHQRAQQRRRRDSVLLAKRLSGRYGSGPLGMARDEVVTKAPSPVKKRPALRRIVRQRIGPPPSGARLGRPKPPPPRPVACPFEPDIPACGDGETVPVDSATDEAVPMDSFSPVPDSWSLSPRATQELISEEARRAERPPGRGVDPLLASPQQRERGLRVIEQGRSASLFRPSPSRVARKLKQSPLAQRMGGKTRSPPKQAAIPPSLYAQSGFRRESPTISRLLANPVRPPPRISSNFNQRSEL